MPSNMHELKAAADRVVECKINYTEVNMKNKQLAFQLKCTLNVGSGEQATSKWSKFHLYLCALSFLLTGLKSRHLCIANLFS